MTRLETPVSFGNAARCHKTRSADAMVGFGCISGAFYDVALLSWVIVLDQPLVLCTLDGANLALSHHQFG